jgi:hypothetical protein
MTRSIAILACLLVLTACGQSRLNPLNWFKRSAPVETTLVAATPEDARALVADVLTLDIDQLPGGAILRATGRTEVQGYWEAELVLREGPDADPAKPVYDFRAFPPVGARDVNTPQSREVTVAVYLSDIDLNGVQTITVQGAADARAVRR